MHAVSARAVRTASAVSMLFFLSACSSGPSIVTNAAPDFDLVGYQTFSYLQPLSTDNGNVRTIISTELIDATTGRLQNAGLRYVERGGDLGHAEVFEVEQRHGGGLRGRQAGDGGAHAGGVDPVGAGFGHARLGFGGDRVGDLPVDRRVGPRIDVQARNHRGTIWTIDWTRPWIQMRS